MKVLYISLAVVLIDQASKLLVKGFSLPLLHIDFQGMYPGQMIPVIGDFFRITFIENPGMAFGFNPGIDFKLWISLFSLIASIALIVYLYKVRNKSFSLRLSLAFILGGAVGNLIDRMFYGIIYGYAPVFYGKVVDFFDFDFFNVTILGKSYDRWPIFNVADAAVSVGVLILVFFYRHHKPPVEEAQESKPEDTRDEISDTPGNENFLTKNSSADNMPANKQDEQSTDDKTDKGKEISF